MRLTNASEEISRVSYVLLRQIRFMVNIVNLGTSGESQANPFEWHISPTCTSRRKGRARGRRYTHAWLLLGHEIARLQRGHWRQTRSHRSGHVQLVRFCRWWASVLASNGAVKRIIYIFATPTQYAGCAGSDGSDKCSRAHLQAVHVSRDVILRCVERRKCRRHRSGNGYSHAKSCAN